MNLTPLLALAAALAAGAPGIQPVKLESRPLLLQAGKSSPSVHDDGLTMAENPILIEIRATRAADGSVQMQCDGGSAENRHDFRKGLPQ